MTSRREDTKNQLLHAGKSWLADSKNQFIWNYELRLLEEPLLLAWR
mgnify:CR=1 FL=1